MTGILVIDKPEGFTSHDVVAKLRGILRQRRIGHTGTLDPMATGVLVLLLGRATRAMPFAETHDKEYDFALRLGLSTDTYDTLGTVLQQSQQHVTAAELEAVLPEFVGDIMQVPPMYSAIKVGGKKLYSLARAGESMELDPRPITIHSLSISGEQEYENGRDYLLNVRCSKGSYIRSLCHDLGQRLSCGGAMSYLRRLSVGCFSLSDAHCIESIEQMQEHERRQIILPLDRLFSQYPSCTATPAQEKRIRNGGDYSCGFEPSMYRVYSQDGSFLMLGEVTCGYMKTIKSFYEV